MYGATTKVENKGANRHDSGYLSQHLSLCLLAKLIKCLERSSWSRHGSTCEIGDVTQEEALQYLKNRGVDPKLSSQIYELVGGRMIHLTYGVDVLYIAGLKKEDSALAGM
jgi:hypothetical protein